MLRPDDFLERVHRVGFGVVGKVDGWFGQRAVVIPRPVLTTRLPHVSNIRSIDEKVNSRNGFRANLWMNAALCLTRANAEPRSPS
jgi:hypothetical protein